MVAAVGSREDIDDSDGAVRGEPKRGVGGHDGRLLPSGRLPAAFGPRSLKAAGRTDERDRYVWRLGDRGVLRRLGDGVRGLRCGREWSRDVFVHRADKDDRGEARGGVRHRCDERDVDDDTQERLE